MKRLFAALLLLACLTPLAATAEDARTYLERGAYNEAYIAARASGDEEVMRLSLEQIAERPELWRVRWEAGKAGYADVSGAWRIAPQFFFAKDFNEEGYAPAKQAQDRAGVIDRTGAFVVPPEWDNVWDIQGKYARVCVRDRMAFSLMALVELNGTVVVEPGFPHLGYPSEGLINVWGNTDRAGYIDMAGNWVIPPDYLEAYPFQDGVARVREARTQKYARVGVIDREGNWVERPKWQDITEPDAEGRRFVCKKIGGQWGLIGADGLWIVRPRWDALREPDGKGNRTALVDGLWGLIDANGSWLVKPCWLETSLPGEQGTRAVRAADGLWGMIDADGGWLAQPQFDYEWLGAFSAYGCALFRDAQGVGALNRAYRVVWQLPCESIGPLRDGVVTVTCAQGREEGCVDFLGNLLWMGKKEI